MQNKDTGELMGLDSDLFKRDPQAAKDLLAIRAHQGAVFSVGETVEIDGPGGKGKFQVTKILSRNRIVLKGVR